VDITPEPGVAIHGVLMRGGRAAGARGRLFARSLALDDGTTKLVLTVCDVRMIGRRICDEAKKIVSQGTGIPAANLLVAATHTHGTPTPVDLFDDGPYVKWQQAVIDGAAASMTQAVANLAPARIGRTSVRKPDYVFNRRWKLKDPADMPPNPFGETTDGVLTNPASRRDKLLEPAGPVDDELTVLSLQHADGRPLGMLANYSTHYVGGYAEQLVSSDYYGVFADEVRKLMGAPDAFQAMMFNGTSGDVNTIDFTAPPDKSPPWTRIDEIGKDMAQTAVKGLKSVEYQSEVTLAAAVAELDLGVRKPDAKRLAWAKQLAPGGKRPGNGWPGMYAAEVQELAKYPDRVTMPMQTLRVGDIGIAAIPCEAFAQTGLDIKRASPIKPTFNIGLANGYFGYLPTPEQHALGGYETWPARTSYLEVEASTKIRDTALKLLADVKDE
jgi:hypothetical protein